MPPEPPHTLDPAVSLRERLAASPWRRRIGARRSLNQLYRTGVAVVGSGIVGLGLVTVPLPGPGWLTVIAGLLILSSEFAWAERLLIFTKRHVARWAGWLARQPLTLRLAVAAGTVAFTYAAVVVALHLVGVPAWIPDAVPLWR